MEVFLRDGPLEKLRWGRAKYKKNIRARENLPKKIPARQLILKQYSCHGLKQIHTRKLIRKKKFLRFENSPPLITFLMVGPLKKFLVSYLTKEIPSFATFQFKRLDCMKILLPYGNTIFAILFCFVLCTKSLL